MESKHFELQDVLPGLDRVPWKSLDPYLIWACLTKFRGYDTPTADEINEQPLCILADLGSATTHSGESEVIKVLKVPAPIILPRFISVATTLGQLIDALSKHPDIDVELSIPILQPTPNANILWERLEKRKPASRLIAVIDDGCPILNRQFWLNDSPATRFRHVWHQSGKANAYWHRPKGLYGAELSRSTIDKLLRLGQDEEQTYLNELMYPLVVGSLEEDPEVAYATHGSHVMDLVAGRIHPLTEELDEASQADLIFVQLSEKAVRDSSGGSLGFQLFNALQYVLAHCSEDTCAVANISYGTQAGPHDGSSILERAMDHLMQTHPNFGIVLGAGNSRRSRAHVHVALAPDSAERIFQFNLPDDDVTDSFVEIWYRAEDSANAAVDDLEVSLQAPDGTRITATADQIVALVNQPEERIAAIIHSSQVPTGSRSMALLALAGKLPDGLEQLAAPAGSWTIGLKALGPHTMVADVWLERDDLPRRAGARPLAFDERVAVNETDTLSNLATGHGPVVVGGCIRTSRRQASYSSLGPTANGDPRPHVLGPSDESGSLKGLRAGAVQSGKTFRMAGTSVAAPVVARALFNQLLRQSPTVPDQDQWTGRLLTDALQDPAAAELGLTRGAEDTDA